MIFTPGEEIRTRIGRLRPLMEKGRLDAAFFHYKIDYYYLSGTMQDAFLFIPLERDPVLFVKRDLKRARRESPLEEVMPLKALEEIKPYVAGMKRIGLQLDVMPYNMVMKCRDRSSSTCHPWRRR
jgi:Xaa-Pro aminopeptidase